MTEGAGNEPDSKQPEGEDEPTTSKIGGEPDDPVRAWAKHKGFTGSGRLRHELDLARLTEQVEEDIKSLEDTGGPEKPDDSDAK